MQCLDDFLSLCFPLDKLLAKNQMCPYSEPTQARIIHQDKSCSALEFCCPKILYANFDFLPSLPLLQSWNWNCGEASGCRIYYGPYSPPKPAY